MTWLSWLIYLAEISERLNGLFVAASILCTTAIIVMALAWAITEGEYPIGQRWLRFALAAGTFGFIACLIPSQKTVLMIAGSEATAAIITTPEAREMMGDLKDVIRGRLKDLKSDSEKK